MGEISSSAVSSAAPPAPLSSHSEPSSPWHYLSGLIVQLAAIAGVVVMSLKGQLADVPGWVKLVALAWAGMAASERARIATIAVRGWFRRR